MAEVVQFKPVPDDAVVELLERLLAAAKDGRVQGVVFIADGVAGYEFGRAGTVDAHVALGHLARLSYNLNRELSDMDPVIRAMVQKIPPPGSPWGLDGQVLWLRMIAMAFNMVYGGKRQIKIEAEPEAKAL